MDIVNKLKKEKKPVVTVKIRAKMPKKEYISDPTDHLPSRCFQQKDNETSFHFGLTKTSFKEGYSNHKRFFRKH